MNANHWLTHDWRWAAAALAIFCDLTGSGAVTQTRIRLATLAPRGSSVHQSLQAMGEKWRSAPGGGVALTIYPDGTMGSEADMVKRMRVGQIQAATLTADGLSEIDKSVTALQEIPMMYRTLDELAYVRGKLLPVLEKRLYDKGFVVLFWGDAGYVKFFSKDQAVRPADFKKMKVFVRAGDIDHAEIMKEAGFRPVSLEWADALPSLQTGLVDVVPTAPFYALSGQFYIVTRHMLEVNWVPLAGGTVVTRKAWEALPAETRAALLQSAATAGQQIQDRMRAESNEAVEAMKKRGVQVHTLTPDLESEWRKTAEGFYPKVRGSLVPADMFDEVSRLVAEYRAGHKETQLRATR